MSERERERETDRSDWTFVATEDDFEYNTLYLHAPNHSHPLSPTPPLTNSPIHHCSGLSPTSGASSGSAPYRSSSSSSATGGASTSSASSSSSSSSGAKPAGGKFAFLGGGAKCPACTKTVYKVLYSMVPYRRDAYLIVQYRHLSYHHNFGFILLS